MFSGAENCSKQALQESDNGIALSIQDQGPGIPDYAIDKIFNRFYSLSRPGTGKKSTGLGLAFVKEVAELHGGHAHVEMHPQGGAIACLDLPKIPQTS